MPIVFNQLSLSSCTASALVTIYYSIDPSFIGSRLFLYYNERSLDDDVEFNTGSSLYQGINALSTIGLCNENLWPYIINNFNIKPTDECYIDAKKHLVTKYFHVATNENDIKLVLSLGHLIVAGIKIYESFHDPIVATSGYVNIPDKNEKKIGGHAVVIFGYDDTKKLFLLRNDWGYNWGDKGNFYLPYEYLSDEHLATDLWIITEVTKL